MNLHLWACVRRRGFHSASSCMGSRVVDQYRTVFLYCEATVICWTTFVYVFCFGWSTTSCIIHNFQRRMSRLEQRWRAQRSVISIVNCRIPWINRDLNVYCAFGICLKACLLQCLLILMPLTCCTKLVWCSHVCVFVCQGASRPWRIQCTGVDHNKQFE